MSQPEAYTHLTQLLLTLRLEFVPQLLVLLPHFLLSLFHCGFECRADKVEVVSSMRQGLLVDWDKAHGANKNSLFCVRATRTLLRLTSL